MTAFVTDRRKDPADRHPDQLLSARDAEKVLGIPAATVRVWWHRRERTNLWDYGKDHRGRPMFYARDLLELRRKGRLPKPSEKREMED